MTETRWLDDTEQLAWRSWIDAARRIETAIERQLKTDHGLTVDDYEVLVRLTEVEGRRMRLTDLAASIGNSPSRLSQRIDRMAEGGLVARESDPADRRVAMVCLTPDGFARLAGAAPSHVAEVRRQFHDHLSDTDVKALARILPKLLAR